MRPQVLVLRLSAACLVLAAAACEPTNEGYQPEQPIIYSHAVHAGDLSIPCQYCHFAAERGRFAGIPPASVCMNCHKQVRKEHPEVVKIAQAIERNEPIAWVRVHRLPDHAFFDHSVHIGADVACQTCHGAIQEMALVRQASPLTMGWCLDCHRQQPIDDRAAVQNPRVGRLTDCANCHH